MKALFVLILGSFGCGSSTPPQTTAAPPTALPTASAEAPRADPWTSAALARSNATAAPGSGFKLLVTKSAISLADGTHLVPVPADASRGVDASYKRGGPNGLYIEPVARVFQTQSERDAVLAVNPSVPYRLFVEVLYTLGQNEVKRIHLLVRSTTDVTSIETTLPRAPGDALGKLSGLGLAVLIVGDGISVKARGGNVAPGCKDVGAGLAIPNRDMTALAECAKRLKDSNPEFASETTVTISANPNLDFQTLVTTMDALRPTFPIVTFGIAR